MTWNDTQLDALAMLLDPVADAAVATVYTEGWRVPLMHWLAQASRNDDPLPAGLPADVVAFFETPLPSWADPTRLAIGQSLFPRYAVPMLQTFLVRSLPEVYAAERIAIVLGRSQRLEAQAPRRLWETLQFFVDVASPDAFSQRGLRTTLRVRLLHAAIRRFMPGEAAINQEDLAATLVTFSAFILEGLERWGVGLSEAEQDGWMHVWEVVGAVLGLQTRFTGREDAAAFFACFRQRHHRTSVHGVALTKALLDFCDTLLPGTGVDGLNESVFRFLSGDALADLLEVGPADWTRALIGPYRHLVAAVDVVQDHHALARDLSRELALSWVHGLLAQRLPNGQARFLLPQHLFDGAIVF